MVGGQGAAAAGLKATAAYGGRHGSANSTSSSLSPKILFQTAELFPQGNLMNMIYNNAIAMAL